MLDASNFVYIMKILLAKVFTNLLGQKLKLRLSYSEKKSCTVATHTGTLKT
jgi:hypothetical protein